MVVLTRNQFKKINKNNQDLVEMADFTDSEAELSDGSESFDSDLESDEESESSTFKSKLESTLEIDSDQDSDEYSEEEEEEEDEESEEEESEISLGDTDTFSERSENDEVYSFNMEKKVESKNGKKKKFLFKNKKNSRDSYSKFNNLIDKIGSGEFFLRIPIEDRKSELKRKFSENQIEDYTDQLVKVRKLYEENSPSVIDILKRDITPQQKCYLLEKMHIMANCEVLSEDYTKALQAIQQFDEKATLDSYDHYRAIIEEKFKNNQNNKTIAMEKLRVMETYKEKDTSEYAKYKHWLDTLLSIPFGIHQDIQLEDSSLHSMQQFMKKARETLDSEISYMEKPKDQVLNLIAQLTRNKSCNVNALGIYGAAGTGKSSLVKSMAKALNRPYRMISLGGESDNSVLVGHGHTYIGSCQGRIVDFLRETACMNGVLMLDEVDKISDTPRGREVIGTLIHLIDHTTNNRFNYDRYLSGIEFDLSKILFVFTYNDPSAIDKIFADRLYKIKVDNYTVPQKFQISIRHVIPQVLEQFNYTSEEVIFPDSTINKVINLSNSKGGIRDIKRSFERIVSRINTLLLTGENSDIIRLDYSKLSHKYRALPVTINEEDISILLEENGTSGDMSDDPPMGMYT